MFDVSLSELLLVAVIALVVLGPQRLPEVARAAGRWAGRVRRFVEDVKRDIDREVGDKDLAALRQIHQDLSDTRGLLERSAQEALSAVSEVRDGAAGPPAAAADTTRTAAALERPARPGPRAPKKRRKAAAPRRHAPKRPARR